MKKLIATATVAAGLGSGLMAGVQAQTVDYPSVPLYGYNSSNQQVFDVLLSPSVTSPTPYIYSYTAKVVSESAPIGTFSFLFGMPVKADPSASSLGNFKQVTNTGELFVFDTSPKSGLLTGQSATFAFTSPLPPTATISADAHEGATAGGGIATIGPGPVAVPEPASLALLGLGILPVAFIARKRFRQDS